MTHMQEVVRHPLLPMHQIPSCMVGYIQHARDKVCTLYNTYAIASRCMEHIVSAEKGFCADRKGFCADRKGLIINICMRCRHCG